MSGWCRLRFTMSCWCWRCVGVSWGKSPAPLRRDCDSSVDPDIIPAIPAAASAPLDDHRFLMLRVAFFNWVRKATLTPSPGVWVCWSMTLFPPDRPSWCCIPEINQVCVRYGISKIEAFLDGMIIMHKVTVMKVRRNRRPKDELYKGQHAKRYKL